MESQLTFKKNVKQIYVTRSFIVDIDARKSCEQAKKLKTMNTLLDWDSRTCPWQMLDCCFQDELAMHNIMHS